MRFQHEIEPVYDRSSKILILGSFPSPKSRETGFYYGHPQNRFWPLLSALLGERRPEGNEEKRALLLRRRIALWDVLDSCEIRGADDASITAPKPNDVGRILLAAPIAAVFTNGRKATALYRRFCLPVTGREPVFLPSTSPANQGRYPMERLLTEWQVILPFLNDTEN